MRQLLALMIACGTVLAGCERDNGAIDEGTLEASAVVAQDPELDGLRATAFLQLIDGDVAALWLALHAQDSGERTRPSDAVVSHYEAIIRELATRLLEDRRMIANRTVQTRNELAEHGIPVTVDELVTGLLEVARSGVVGSYGSYCDYYINLRRRSLGHAGALAEMRSLRVLAPAAAP